MKILIKDTDEAQRAMVDSHVAPNAAEALKGKSLDDVSIDSQGWALVPNPCRPGGTYFIHPDSFTIIETKD